MTNSARTARSDKVVDVLLVEDDPQDIELIESALQQTQVRHVLHVIPDGADALDYLERAGRYRGAPRPDMILLDLGLPRRTGFEVIERLKGLQSLRTIPVIILTDSREQRDVWRGYHLHANAYMVKPDNLEDFRTALWRLADFYLRHVQFAPADEPAEGGLPERRGG